MKAKKLLWITLALVVSSALLLTGSLALLAGATEGESPLPEASALPDVSDIPTEGENVELPGETVGDTVLTEKDGKITASFLTPEELTLLQERRDGGEWLTLSLEEMTAIVEETVRMFYASHTLEVGSLVGGVYTVKTYNGYLYYTSDEYKKLDIWTAPDVAKDVFDVILWRLFAYHDAITAANGCNYAFVDMPRLEDNQIRYAAYNNGHLTFCNETRETAAYDYICLEGATHTISLVEHSGNGSFCERDEETLRPICATETPLFYDETFENAFVKTELVENSHRVQIEIYRESTHELVASLVIDNPEEAKVIYDTFITCLQKACDECFNYGTAQDYAYRSEYRVVVKMMTTYENEVISDQWDRYIAYPYGYTNEIYGQAWNGDIWNFMDYHVPFGKPLLDMLESYVAPMIPAE
ncbi:MAG: hypothetical protein IKV50_00320 [Clostridia bacterium]|nr:hypothetical protein [Clostridia bacterium]MBR6554038.1 hypothetical protein [Clostridia bacterium]